MRKELFIASLEHEYLRGPIKLKNYRVQKMGGYYFLYVEFDHAVSFTQKNRNKVFNKAFLFPRHKRRTKNQFDNLPLEVHVLEFKEDPFIPKEAYNLGWAVLYDNYESAKNHDILKTRKGCFRFWQ